MKNKRGSQVGFVLSFLIFVFFVFFLFLIVQPSLKTSNSQNLPENIVNKIEAASIGNVTSISIALDKSNPQPCVLLTDFFPDTGAGNKLVAQNETGATLQLRKGQNGNDLYVTKNASDDFIKIYEDEEFNPLNIGDQSPCHQLSSGSGYHIGLIKTTDYVFTTKLLKLFGNYSSDYNGLKSEWGVSEDNNFGFSFRYENGTVISTTVTNARVNIYAYETAVQYINPNGNIESGFINVRTW